MNQTIAETQIGENAHAGLEIKGAKLIGEVDGKLKMDGIELGNAKVTVELDAAAILDLIAKAIPGTIDDAIIGVAKAALLGK